MFFAQNALEHIMGWSCLSVHPSVHRYVQSIQLENRWMDENHTFEHSTSGGNKMTDEVDTEVLQFGGQNGNYQTRQI